jgi:guanine deaminase
MGLGSDVAGGPDLSIFSVMRVGFYAQNARAWPASRPASAEPTRLDSLGTLGGAEALGLEDATGSLEAGKEADSSPSTLRTSRRSPASSTTNPRTSRAA